MRLPRLLLPLAVVVAALAVAGPALADGDPASDYLIAQPVFIPFAPTKVTAPVAGRLREVLATSKSKGYEIRVALIGPRTDLGAVPFLCGRPQRYADFLGQELVYYRKG